jgi:uncharacterized protein (TIRG00374 family)
MAPSGVEKTPARPAPWWNLALRGVVLSAALVFLVRGVSWHDMSGAIERAGFLLPAVVVAMNAGMMGLRALRLRLLLQRKIAFPSAFVTLLTSSAINNITPFRGGNVARLWMLERAAGVTKSAALALTLVENLLEVTVLAAIGFASSWFVAGQRWATVATPVVLLTAIAVLVLLRITTGRTAGSVAACPKLGSVGWLVKARQLLIRLEPGFRTLSQPGVPALALLLSLLAWTCEAGMILICARSMGLAIPFPLAMVVLLGINLALALPSTPASAGPFEGATVAVLTLAGFAKAPAVAFAIFYHAIQVIPVTLVGATLVLLAKRRQSSQAGCLEHRPV